MSLDGRTQALRATPAARSVPELWLLGSSDYAARLAAERGLPYVFAHHFSGEGTAEALALYRSGFQPSEHLAAPRTFLTVNAVVADTEDDARRLALPQLLTMLALRTGQPLSAGRLVEEAEKVELSEAQREILDRMATRWMIGDAASARRQLGDLAERFGVEEIMINPVAGAFVGTEPDTAPARERTLELLATAA